MKLKFVDGLGLGMKLDFVGSLEYYFARFRGTSKIYNSHPTALAAFFIVSSDDEVYSSSKIRVVVVGLPRALRILFLFTLAASIRFSS
jgi:hypothetical protein